MSNVPPTPWPGSNPNKRNDEPCTETSNLEVCQYCKLPVDAQWDHATGLDCLDAMTEDRDKLHAALVAIRDGQIIQGMSPALLAEKVLRGAPAPEPRDGV